MIRQSTITPFGSKPIIRNGRVACASVEHWCITASMDAKQTGPTIDTTIPNWERACVAQVKNGIPDSFTPLVEFYSGRIYAHLYRMVYNREEAEDLTQETFIRAYRKISTYDPSRPFRNWIYTIASNIGRNAARTKSRRISTVPELTQTGESVFDFYAVSEDNSTGVKEQLSLAVNQLPEPLPVLIQLFYQEGFTIRECAQILDMGESATKVALHRARKTLRTIMLKEEK